MKITGTFLDEISHDIPHQNWGIREWDNDFSLMQGIGINTVILIRCGYKRWLTYPSKYLMENEGAYQPTVDLVSMFLDLSEKYGMNLWFGLYDSGKYWWEDSNFQKETDVNLSVVDEVWKLYGHHPAFKGWYLTQEVSRRTKGVIDLYRKLGLHCKAVSSGLPTLISPYIDGSKAILSGKTDLTKTQKVTFTEHERDWQEIFAGIEGCVDVVAFQDGQVDYDELPHFLTINKNLADKHKLTCWTNIETFDRDMPIKFLPIKWEKMKLKLEAAQKTGIEKAITFEFSHFMSPQSAYPQAGHLFNRYREWLRS